jgi:hypothetical protein
VTETRKNKGDPNVQERARIGLCVACRYMRKIQSDRGSIFFFCQLSTTDERFPKYPRLPVLKCEGYEEAVRLPNTPEAR